MGDNKYKARHKKLGLCKNCSRKVIPGKLRCIIHTITGNEKQKITYLKIREKRIKQMRERKNRLRKEGRCPDCGVKLDPEYDKGYICCVNCLDNKRGGRN